MPAQTNKWVAVGEVSLISLKFEHSFMLMKTFPYKMVFCSALNIALYILCFKKIYYVEINIQKIIIIIIIINASFVQLNFLMISSSPFAICDVINYVTHIYISKERVVPTLC